MEMTAEDKRLLQVFRVIVLNSFINSYAVERVAFGYEKPGDKAPIELYSSIYNWTST